MPRAILVYRLPQEAEEHQTALDGWKWRAVLQELDQEWKYVDGLQEARARLQSAVTEAGLELFE